MLRNQLLEDEDLKRKLIQNAIEARKFSYSPYSEYQVGACLITKDGKLYKGCNIENAAYGPTNCAERTAIFKAVSEGEKSFAGIAIVGSKKGDTITDYAYPCGVCRQVMMEFCNPKEFVILVAKSEEDYKQFTLEELLPNGFGPDNL